MQAPLFDGFAFDPFSLFDDGFCSAEVGICGCDVFQALVIALVIVVFDERFDLRFQIAGEVIILQQDAVFQGLVPVLDLPLRLRAAAASNNVTGKPAWAKAVAAVIPPMPPPTTIIRSDRMVSPPAARCLLPAT
jgi:hypothetical protein